jgi:hypothetical protein
MTGMAFQATLVVQIQGDRLAEGRVQSAITRGGATVDQVIRRIAPNGSREHEIVVAFERYRSLDEIVRVLGEVRGVAVTAMTLLPARTDRGRTKEAL